MRQMNYEEKDFYLSEHDVFLNLYDWIYVSREVLYMGNKHVIMSWSCEQNVSGFSYKAWVTLSELKDDNGNYIRVPINKILPAGVE